MSIVGTRPPLIGEVAEYELHHRARLKPALAGMTYDLDGAVFRILWPNEETLYDEVDY